MPLQRLSVSYNCQQCEVEAVEGAASKLFMPPDPFHSHTTHISSIKPGIDLLHEQTHLTIDSLINWINVMARVNYLRVTVYVDLPPNILDVYQKSFDTLTKDMASTPATYTKERFTIITSELHTMLDNRKINPDNFELPSNLPACHLPVGYHFHYRFPQTGRFWCSTRGDCQGGIDSSSRAQRPSRTRTPAIFRARWGT